MKEIRELVEKMEYISDDFFIEWGDELRDYFYPLAIDDIGRLDHSAYNYLISLNKNNEKLLSGEIDLLIENEDAYFMEVIISREKFIGSVHFWQYPKGSKGQVLNISEEGFLAEHGQVKKKFNSFAKENGIVVLANKELRYLVPYEGEMVSIYYKYFDDEYESSKDIPY